MYRRQIQRPVTRPAPKAAEPEPREETPGPSPRAELFRRLLLTTRAAKKRPATRLTVGRQAAGGVTVEETVLDARTRRVEINGSCGVVVGDRNRQHNRYHYKLADRPVSLPKLLTATPAHTRALSALIRDPGDAAATRAMSALLARQADRLLSGRSAVSTRSAPKQARLTGVLGPSGEIVVNKSRGVVVGRGNVQNNHFHYRIEQPEALLARSLSQNEGALTRIAELYGAPEDRADDRKLADELRELITTRTSVERITREHGAAVEHARAATGVMLGAGNTRTDEVLAPRPYRRRPTVRSQSLPKLASRDDTTSPAAREAERSSGESRNLNRDR
ncbi:hypothetical protein ACIBEJ_15070 [Nonomuraea sp. NPDC050790]|uniref:hypothetical protein n=1 Tax=Nonomuraea sp. NPDC050790 TaxID=3364371 RepID=UPI0037B26417